MSEAAGVSSTSSESRGGSVSRRGDEAVLSPHVGFSKRSFFRACHFAVWLWMVGAYRFQAYGVSRIPATGPLLILSNHQSFLDPIIVGLGVHARPFHAMARASLWKSRIMAPFFDGLNGIPVDRGESDLGAMRTCIEVLQAGRALMLFPEGTRTPDGRTRPFKAGVMTIIRRARPTVLPTALEGAYDVWSKHRKTPKLSGRIGVLYGQPIPADEIINAGKHGGLELLRDRVESLRVDLAGRLAR